MNVNQMNFSEQTLSKIAQLAMAVEIHEHKRFPVRKSTEAWAGLLKVAVSSSNPEVSNRLGEFSDTLDDQARAFFRNMKINLAESARSAKPGVAKQTYRGQVVTKEASAQAPAEEPSNTPEAGKRKIIYRGKVIYK